MDVLIIDKRRSLPVTSVVLSRPNDDPNGEKMHMFFCWNCQNPMFQYIGRVVSIMAGSTPNAIPIILKCGRCGNVIQVSDIL